MVVEMHVIIAQRQLTRLIVGRQDRPGDPVGQIIRQRDRHGDDHDGDDDELRLQRGHRRLHRRKPRIDEDDILVAIRGIDDRGAGHIADLRVVAILIIDDDGGLSVLGRESLQIKLFIAVQHQRLARTSLIVPADGGDRIWLAAIAHAVSIYAEAMRAGDILDLVKIIAAAEHLRDLVCGPLHASFLDEHVEVLQKHHLRQIKDA